jgi:DNA-binding NarL/FixJ family response regulator
MNGLEATRQIRERHSRVRILALSMYDDDEYVREIIQAGPQAMSSSASPPRTW